MANGLTLSDLNRMKREVAISGAAGTADIPYLYELFLQGQEAPAVDMAPAPALPEDEPGSDFAFDYFSSPGAEIDPLGLGAGAPAAQPAGPGRARGFGGRGDAQSLSAASPTTGLAQSYSPELEAFLEDHFSALMDPTTIGRVAPGVGLAMDLVGNLQEEDYLGAAGTLAGAVAPLGLSTLASMAQGLPVDPSALGTAFLQSQTNVTPIGMAQDVIGRGEGLSLRDLAAGAPPGGHPFSTDTPVTEGYSLPGVAPAVEDELSAAVQFALENQPAPPGSRGYDGPLSGLADTLGLTGAEKQAFTSQLPAHDVTHTQGATLAGLGLVSGLGPKGGYGLPDSMTTSFAEDEDDFMDMVEAGVPAALAAQLAATSPVAANALAAAPASSLAALAARSVGASSFGGRDRGGYAGSSTGRTGFEGSPELGGRRGRSRGRGGGGNGGSTGGSTGAGTAGSGGGGGNAGW